MKMGWERERENRKRQMERLKIEKWEEQEKLQLKIKKILKEKGGGEKVVGEREREGIKKGGEAGDGRVWKRRDSRRMMLWR